MAVSTPTPVLKLVWSECWDSLSVLEWLNPFYIQLHLSPSSYASSEEHKEEAVQEDSEEEGNLIWFSSSILLLLFFPWIFLMIIQSFIISS